MKSFTDLEQSRKLAEFLPFESADMAYWQKYRSYDYAITVRNTKELRDGFEAYRIEYIPCWSLAALLSVIPQELFDGEYIINITEGVNNKWIISYDPPYDISSYLNVSGDNLIDCCVEMIIKLKERKLL